MKKKLLIAAAVVFAVFAIPCGSNALTTVSVASENNTVTTPTVKPVAEVKRAVDAIDVSKITDETSAYEAFGSLASVGTADLQNAMNAGRDTVNDIAAIEAAYKRAKGIGDTAIQNSGSVRAVGVVGAAFSGSNTTLNVEAPASTPAINSSAYTVTSNPVYVEINLKNNGYAVTSMAIPVAVTIETPAGVDGSKAVIFHFVDGTLEEIKPIYDATANTLTFTVKHFSTFAIAEGNANAGTANGSTTNGSTANGSTTVEDEGPSISAFESYRENLCREIADAKDGTTFTITRDKNINALPNDIMKALYMKKTVALKLEYTFEGKDYTVTIPAGKAENNDIQWYGPLYLQMRYGK